MSESFENEAKRYRQERLNNEELVSTASAIAERKAAMLTKIVHDNANPNPIVIAAAVAAVFVFAWLLYVWLLKPCASGEWVDTEGNKWYLDHSRMSGTVRASVNGGLAKMCYLSDNLFRCGDKAGVWDYDDLILFVGGGGLTRVRH